MPRTRLRRLITIFEKDGDDFVGELEISEVEFRMIASRLGYQRYEEMYDCYPIDQSIINEINRSLGGRLAQGHYVYYLESDLETIE